MSHNHHEHTWEEAQAEEAGFWGDCGNTLGEEIKQLVYARYMGLEFFHDGNSPYNLDFHNEPVLDVGGGPASMLLKAKRQPAPLDVADPCHYPLWVARRYEASGITYIQEKGEALDQLDPDHYGTVLMYNVLQHTDDPEKIFCNIYRALKPGGTFRFFDWVDTATNTAHPISLHFEDMADMLKKAGFDPASLSKADINENYAIGTAVFGAFVKPA